MQNIAYLRYTYMHRQAFKFVLDKISHFLTSDELSEMKHRATYHDLDKALLYTLCSKTLSSNYHRATASHHMENDGEKSLYDFIEAVIDYECAGYTKEDKPRNAYDTILDFSPSHSDELMAICHRFGIDKHYLNTPNDNEWIEFKKNIVLPTDESIMKEIYEYMIEYPENAKTILEYANDKLLYNISED